MGINELLTRETEAAVVELPVEKAEQAVEVLADAFYDYPVMTHVIGQVGMSYSARLKKLMRFFVAARYAKDEPVLAVSDNGQAVATAILTPPFPRQAPSSLAKHREALWRGLGQPARERYENLGEVWQQFSVTEPHYHLNMIGVQKAYAGSGLGGLLLDAIHDLSLKDANSAGVCLNTEDKGNVPLYERFGYEVIGHKIVLPDLETWVMFRKDRR